MIGEKVMCPQCQREGKRSKVFFYSGQRIPAMEFTGGYWDEDGNFVEPKVEFAPPWYICSNGHITQTYK
jgi:hypothetical protein